MQRIKFDKNKMYKTQFKLHVSRALSEHIKENA